MSEGVKLCPRCLVPMIEEGTPVSRAWVCLVCGATFVEPKEVIDSGKANRGDNSIHDGDSRRN